MESERLKVERSKDSQSCDKTQTGPSNPGGSKPPEKFPAAILSRPEHSLTVESSLGLGEPGIIAKESSSDEEEQTKAGSSEPAREAVGRFKEERMGEDDHLLRRKQDELVIQDLLENIKDSFVTDLDMELDTFNEQEILQQQEQFGTEVVKQFFENYFRH